MPTLDQKFETGGVGLTITLNVGVTAGGSDRAIVATIGQFDYATGPSGVTCNGVAMTQMSTGATNGTNHVSIWYIANPDSGSAVIIATWAASTGARILASSWTGVDQTTPMASFVSATGTSTAPSIAATNASGATAIDVAVASKKALSGGSDTALSVANNSMGSQYSTSVNPTMSWECSSVAWAICAASLQASSTVSPPITGSGTGTVTASELRVVPMRAGPAFSTQTTSSVRPEPMTTENNAPAWEASGMFPTVLEGTVQPNGDIIWDTAHTLASVAPAGRISVAGLPTRNSPSGSLIVTTQDTVFLYPLPFGRDPSTTAYPILAASRPDADYNTDLVPVFYPSAIDFGTALYELLAVQCIGQDFTPEVDSWAMSYCWGDTATWETTQRYAQPHAVFFPAGRNRGSLLKVSVNIHDGADTDPVPPTGRHVIYWVRQVDENGNAAKQADRPSPEVQ